MQTLMQSFRHCYTVFIPTIVEPTDLTWRFMSTGRRYVYCVVEKQKCYSPFVLQNKLLVYDLWSGTYCYYRSSSSSDLAEFYETSHDHGIAIMDDGEDVSFHSVKIDHKHRRLDIGQARLTMGKSANVHGNHRTSLGFSTRNEDGVTMVIPFENGISVIEMSSKCNIKKTDISCDSGPWSRSEPWQEGRMLYCFHSIADEFEEDEFSGLIVSVDLDTRNVYWTAPSDDRLKSCFASNDHPVRLVRTIHRGNRLWVTTEKDLDNSIRVYLKEGDRWYEIESTIPDNMVLIDVREDGNAMVLDIEKHLGGHFHEDGVPSLLSLARGVVLRDQARVRHDEHLAEVIGFKS
ncbi:hypothetical protein Q1695_013775 [Nippostrongylus brasiliensis]|nr:hypothetical protein Q1695_013775 [Nippostrongylus brasiliensis]